MNMKKIKEMTQSMKNMDFKETRDIMVSIHEHLDILARTNLQIVSILEEVHNATAPKITSQDLEDFQNNGEAHIFTKIKK